DRRSGAGDRRADAPAYPEPSGRGVGNLRWQRRTARRNGSAATIAAGLLSLGEEACDICFIAQFIAAGEHRGAKVARATLGFFQNLAQVITKDAQREQLHATKTENEQNDGRDARGV